MGLQAGPVHCHQRGVGGRQDGEHEAHPSVSREVATPTVHIHPFQAGATNWTRYFWIGSYLKYLTIGPTFGLIM
jgi:hypothetical protein